MGQLYSSDFPYFRIAEPERYIGVLVDDTLRDRWRLFIDGDRRNLPRIVGEVDTINLFHYDSDKTWIGRQFALETVTPKLAPGAVTVMDDIGDNEFFRHLAETSPYDSHVVKRQGKWVGVLGNLSSHCAGEGQDATPTS